MAHHNNTPESVLNAPEQTVIVVSAQPYHNRAARRHVVTPEGKRIRIPKDAQEQAMNKPYRKPVRRG
jgi:hypothetical protein